METSGTNRLLGRVHGQSMTRDTRILDLEAQF